MFLLLIAPVLMSQTWPPPRMPTPEEFEQIQEMMRASTLKPSRSVRDVIDAERPPERVSEKHFEEALARFKDGWFLTSRFSEQQGFEIDTFLLPNAALAKLQVSWKSAVIDGGKAILATATPLESLRIDAKVTSGHIPLPSTAPEGEVQRATASVVLDVPLDFEASVVDCRRPTRVVAGLRCDKDVFVLEVDDLPEDAIVVPLNSKERPLGLVETSREPLFGMKHERISEISYATFTKGPGTRIRFEGRAKGNVRHVRILRPKPARRIEMEATAIQEPEADAYTPRSRRRYAPPEGNPPRYGTLQKGALRLALKSGRSCAVFGHNAPQIWVEMPALDNSKLASVELLPIKVSGRRGDHTVIENGYNADTHRYAWTLEGEDRETPFGFSKLQASAKIRYPLAVREFEFPSATGTPSGKASPSATFDENRVTIPLGEIGAGIVEIRGFDAAGLELKRFGMSQSNETSASYAFMGPVAKVIAYVADSWVETVAKATLRPAPLRPKAMAGICTE
ncbi:MAG: hypothetical protein IPK13_12325 [Deltaproteobacteria bacterium]|nr:hypothetical protein [Deltaproteobacteria bacterium]